MNGHSSKIGPGEVVGITLRLPQEEAWKVSRAFSCLQVANTPDVTLRAVVSLKRLSKHLRWKNLLTP